MRHNFRLTGNPNRLIYVSIDDLQSYISHNLLEEYKRKSTGKLDVAALNKTDGFIECLEAINETLLRLKTLDF
jgi:hypothetical protein